MTEKATHKDPSCQIFGTTSLAILRRGIIVRPELAQFIRNDCGHWDENDWICLPDLRKYRDMYAQSLIEAEKGELGELEMETLKSLRENEIISKNPEAEIQTGQTFGQRLADKIASFGQPSVESFAGSGYNLPGAVCRIMFSGLGDG